MQRIKRFFSWRSAFIGMFVILALPQIAVFAGVDDDVNNLVGRQNRWYFDNQRFHFYPFSAQRELRIKIDDIVIPTLHTTWTVFSVQGVGVVDMCESRGFGLPYGAQITSPSYMKTDGNGGDSATSVDLAQPEPDGLYRTGESSQTFVVCVRNGYEVVEVHEELVTVYMTPVELVRDETSGFYYVRHVNTVAPAATVDTGSINAESSQAGAPSESFPEND